MANKLASSLVEFKSNFKNLFSSYLNTEDEWNKVSISIVFTFIGNEIAYDADLQKGFILFEKSVFNIINNLVEGATELDLNKNLSSVINNWKPLEVG